ncbi:MAG: phenylalanine--tRNA ligase subunit beta [Saccharofermentanales bacterium]
MKTPLNWINDFLAAPITDAGEIAEMLTMTGTKVEGVERTGSGISKVVTGRISSIVKHPNADKLYVCHVDIGSRTLQIVTGAANIREGAMIPVALDGATLARGVRIQTGDLRGIQSEGMMCSVQELGYDSYFFPEASADGIFILPETTEPGLDILGVLGLGDAVIDFEITSNRPDCLSIEGLAREAAVTAGIGFVPLQPQVSGTKGFFTKDRLTAEIREPRLCRRYIARSVRNVRIAPSPQWLASRLRDANVRPINNIVDITNYVMLELGQPMHAFDHRTLTDNTIIVRCAYADEVMTTLDGGKHLLDNSMLVIADKHHPVGMAGIMGGENSQISNDTQEIVFESANFEGINIRLSAKKLGIRTESSSRFEKGLDPENSMRAMDRACQLIEMLGCGEVSEDMIDLYPTRITPPQIPFRPASINAFLGTGISVQTMVRILTDLGCEINGSGSQAICIPPTYRQDLEREVDLSEEVARFYGYNNIEPTLLSGKSTTLGGLSHGQKQKELTSFVMRSSGFYEACTYSFQSPKVFDQLCIPADDDLRNAIVISNPLGEDYSVMRTTMLSSMLEIASTNLSRGAAEFNIYEIAKVYIPMDQDIAVLPDERDILAAVCYSENENYEKAETLMRLKGVVSEVLRQTGIPDISFELCTDHPSFHPGRSMRILSAGESIGTAGYIHPDVAANTGTNGSVAVLMLEMYKILHGDGSQKIFRQLPRFPAVTRDISMVIDRQTPVAGIEKIILENTDGLLESCKLFDVYTGKQIDENKKSIAFKLVFRAPDRTLSDDTVNPVIVNLLRRLSEEAGAVLR